MGEKKWNPNLWRPLGIKPVTVREYSKPGKKHSFLGYPTPKARYEVRGIMPKAPEYHKEMFKTLEDEE